MKRILLVLGIAFSLNVNAQLTTLLTFSGALNGSEPYGDLYYDGTFLYGMTTSGGTVNVNSYGTIFKIKPDGTTYTKLLDFNGTNGANPFGSLISDGIFLYGMTYDGGMNGYGTIFKIKSDGSNYTTLFDFSGVANGSYPQGSLVSDGVFLYGMTYGTGATGYGTIFKIKTDGTNYTKLLDFNGTNGSNPVGSLFYDGSFLYGMTPFGGANDYGTLFKIDPNGNSYLKLLDFAGTTNGSYPQGSLIYDGTFLYGMTGNGGANNDGTLFRIKPDGTGYTKLMDLAGALNGEVPQGSFYYDGTFLYGTTKYGGVNNTCNYGCGTIFKIRPDGSSYSKLLDFADTANGANPLGSLNSDGVSLYGMTYLGGENGLGTVFKLDKNTTGIAQYVNKENTSVYPNPSSGIFTIETNTETKQSMHIYDVNGRAVLSQTITGKTSIDAGNLPAGVYNINLTGAEGVTNKRLVITR